MIVSRAIPRVDFRNDPAGLLRALRHVCVEARVPVAFDGQTIFGEELGSFTNSEATGEAALTVLPPLAGTGENLSSTSVRTSVAACLQVGQACSWIGSAPVTYTRRPYRPDAIKFGVLRPSSVFTSGGDGHTPDGDTPCARPQVLAMHGYPLARADQVIGGAANGLETMQRIQEASVARGEMVNARGETISIDGEVH